MVVAGFIACVKFPRNLKVAGNVSPFQEVVVFLDMICTGDGKAIYLFCFARASLLPEVTEIEADSQSPLIIQKFLDVAAVTDTVSLEEFVGPLTESRMRDLSWVGPRVSHHEKVIEKVREHSPVLPARFGTIFFSPERLETCLKKCSGAISQFLDQVVDKEELAVKCFLEREMAKEKLLSKSFAIEAERLNSLPPGMRYFQEQRIRSKVVKELNLWVNDICEVIRNELGRYAADFRERKVLSREATGINMDMLFNWAFLVPRDSLQDFHSQISRANADHQKEGLFFQLSGPWPPYSFCPSLETEEKG